MRCVLGFSYEILNMTHNWMAYVKAVIPSNCFLNCILSSCSNKRSVSNHSTINHSELPKWKWERDTTIDSIAMNGAKEEASYKKLEMLPFILKYTAHPFQLFLWHKAHRENSTEHNSRASNQERYIGILKGKLRWEPDRKRFYPKCYLGDRR